MPPPDSSLHQIPTHSHDVDGTEPEEQRPVHEEKPGLTEFHGLPDVSDGRIHADISPDNPDQCPDIRNQSPDTNRQTPESHPDTPEIKIHSPVSWQ